MIGTKSDNRGRSRDVEDEEILNVIRRSKNKEVPTPDIIEDDSITIGSEGLRQRLNQLEDANRLSSRTVGQLRVWQLGELETDEPVREPALGRAHRWSSLFTEMGKTFGFLAFGLLFAAMVFFILFLHGEAGQITPLFFSQRDLLVGGYAVGYTGAGMGVLAGVTLGVGTLIPKATEFWLNWNRGDEGREG